MESPENATESSIVTVVGVPSASVAAAAVRSLHFAPSADAPAGEAIAVVGDAALEPGTPATTDELVGGATGALVAERVDAEEADVGAATVAAGVLEPQAPRMMVQDAAANNTTAPRKGRSGCLMRCAILLTPPGCGFDRAH
ncbi:hypothetical protein [Nakamurella sp. PAMC28650]|uniref:hypothetical protein n=1 Tax=Nakamurella sp. PAMC28650 TaxID=2762325 RepID=UPI00164DD84B|nr:hypothetical protein [Nakamurella sp. PAMC28650]QNK83214.1 hypothetical protein H7F38_11545 [Nakamurella sp. PAMC28650]